MDTLNPAIVVVAFNRPESLQRILTYINNAIYPNQDITLIISIDYQDSEGNRATLDLANSFQWDNGVKIVKSASKNLGLRKHVIQCGDLTQLYDSIIMLEDDLVVSKYYYLYALDALNFYKENDQISGISLYNHKSNYNIDLPFIKLEDQFDVYFMQIASSWGQAWTSNQWSKFRNWYSHNPLVSEKDKIPKKIKSWPESSWVKYYIKYLVEKDLFFVFPQKSFSANLGVPGTHHKNKEYTYSVPFHINYVSSRFCLLSDSINIYDCFFEPHDRVISKLFSSKIAKEIATVDLYGTKDLSNYRGQLILSSRKIENNAAILSYSIDLKPLVANCMFDQIGTSIHIAKAESFVNDIRADYEEWEWDYYFGKIRIRDFVRIAIAKIKNKYLKSSA